MKYAWILTVLALTVSVNAMAADKGDPKCFKFLKANMDDLAIDGYQVASSTSFAFSHTAVRDGVTEVVYQAEMSNGQDQKFRDITLDQECDAIKSMGSLTDE